MSQLGPARMRFDLRCDCTYTSRVGMMFGRIVEEGYYRVGDGEIELIRPAGSTRWPYAIEDGNLLLTESPGEVHEYRRTEARGCVVRERARRGVAMKDELFTELVESTREGGEILLAERAPSRRFDLEDSDVRVSREAFEEALDQLPDVEPEEYDRL